MKHNSKFNFAGKQAVSAMTLKIVPYVIKHFSDFEGTITLKSGGTSAKFNKLYKAFEKDLCLNTKCRMWVDGTYSICIRISLLVSSPEENNYFASSIYFAQSNNGLYKYKGVSKDCINTHQSIIGTSYDDLVKIDTEIQKLENQILKIKSTVPHYLSDLMSK